MVVQPQPWDCGFGVGTDWGILSSDSSKLAREKLPVFGDASRKASIQIIPGRTLLATTGVLE